MTKRIKGKFRGSRLRVTSNELQSLLQNINEEYSTIAKLALIQSLPNGYSRFKPNDERGLKRFKARSVVGGLEQRIRNQNFLVV